MEFDKQKNYTVAVLKMTATGQTVEMDLQEMIDRLHLNKSDLLSYMNNLKSAKLIELKEERFVSEDFEIKYNKILEIYNRYNSNIDKINNAIKDCKKEIKLINKPIKEKEKEIWNIKYKFEICSLGFFMRDQIIAKGLDETIYNNFVFDKLTDKQKITVEELKKTFYKDERLLELNNQTNIKLKNANNELSILKVQAKITEDKLLKKIDKYKLLKDKQKQQENIKIALEKIDIDGQTVLWIRSNHHENSRMTKFIKNHINIDKILFEYRQLTMKENIVETIKCNKELTKEQLRIMDYKDYLKTTHWQSLRFDILKRDKGICQKCHYKFKKLEVHHLTYDRRGCELPEDLICLCHECHRKIHGLEKGGK